MNLTAEQRETVATELRRFATDLNLSDEQKQRLHTFLSDASEKLEEYKQKNPGVSRLEIVKKVAENRAEIRQRLENFLTPEQLSKWDTEVAKAKQFLGQAVAA